MSKKIVILNGSPRKNGNTSMLVKAFNEGAESAGNTVTEFFLDETNIHGCKGCFGGNSSLVRFFYVLIIETSENGKNILCNAEERWIYCR